jgi:hypothetical protein
MPTDPKTGKRLPGKAGLYAGEPGAPEGAPPMPEGEGAPAEMIPDRDMAPMAEEADSLMLDEMMGNVESALGPAEAMPSDVPVEEEGKEEATADVSAIAQMLDVTPERAMALFDAAQGMPRLAGKPPEEIGQMLAEDVQLRMQVEQLAARSADVAAEDEGADPVGGYSYAKGGASLMGGMTGAGMLAAKAAADKQ